MGLRRECRHNRPMHHPSIRQSLRTRQATKFPSYSQNMEDFPHAMATLSRMVCTHPCTLPIEVTKIPLREDCSTPYGGLEFSIERTRVFLREDGTIVIAYKSRKKEKRFSCDPFLLFMLLSLQLFIKENRLITWSSFSSLLLSTTVL